MANDQLVKTYAAKTDLSAKIGYAVYLADDAKVNNTPVATICGANARAIGIITDPPYGTSYAMNVCVDGYCRAYAGDTIAAGAKLITDTNGALVTGTTDKNHVVAIAQEDAAAGELFDIMIALYDLAA
jgi:hypothetical protein